jgi:hypothetical protein
MVAKLGSSNGSLKLAQKVARKGSSNCSSIR